MSLATQIEQTEDCLGPGYVLRLHHPFLVPTAAGVIQRVADGVFFRSPVPSAKTAFCAFVTGADHFLEECGYLGAPFMFTSESGRIRLYEFRGSPVPQLIEDSEASGEERLAWIRGRLEKLGDQAQLSFSFRAAREAYIGETKAALSKAVERLMLSEMEERRVDHAEAFQYAIRHVRNAIFRERTEAAKDDWLSFANIPPEAFAELYESLAVDAQARRRQGVVYTPAWLARFVVSRLPSLAFVEGVAIDPTCGSGTFLVSFLERLVESAGRHVGLDLASRIRGSDIDPVAVETARLSLDFFARSLGLSTQDWRLDVMDATKATVQADWLIGNFPFGYRTYKRSKDISSVLLQRALKSCNGLRFFALVLPESISYAEASSSAREVLRSGYELEELTRLPEATFEASNVATVVLAGRPGKPQENLLVREVKREHLKAFRVEIYAGKSYTMRLPRAVTDPWRFSPFSNEFESAERRGIPLKEQFDVWIGLQIYGTEGALAASGGKPLLVEPRSFWRWDPSMVQTLPQLVARQEEVRRPGPWDLFNMPKVIIRATTSPSAKERLAALSDDLGLWFTDKFIGFWPKVDVPIEGLAAYFQTRFARVWFKVNNPSRKARVRVLEQMPLPRLGKMWQKAARLGDRSGIVRPPQEDNLFQSDDDIKEWEWFNDVVEAAFELPMGTGNAFEAWLREYELEEAQEI